MNGYGIVSSNDRTVFTIGDRLAMVDKLHICHVPPGGNNGTIASKE